MKANEFVKNCGIDSAKSLLKMGSGYCDIMGYEFHTDELKRLVESWELVESYGGLFEAKIYADSEYRSLSVPQITKRLKQAILDVESCNENPN